MKPLIIAHRGASYIAPENTISAFRAALTIGADGFETDVQLTKDGKMVMHHNYTIDANSNGVGLIYNMTEQELRQFDFGSWKSAEFAGERIPTLDECLDIGEKFRVVNVELKAPSNRETPYVEPVAKAILNSKIADRVIISAFDHSLLRAMKQIAPAIRVGALTMPPLQRVPDLPKYEKFFPVGVSLSELRPEDLIIQSDVYLNTDNVGIRANDTRAMLMELAQHMAAIFPGKDFVGVETEVQKQANLVSYIDNLDFKPDFLHCEYHSCLDTPNLVDEMHKRSIGVNIWTPDNEDDLRQLVRLKPDGIITNRPDILMSILNN